MIFLRFGRIGLLILALLWAQALGLWHGTVHLRVSALPSTAVSVSASASEKISIPSVFGLLLTHQEGVDCQLFDQLAHGDALTPLLHIALALVPTVERLRASHADFLQRWHTQYQARAPPLPC